MRLRWDELSPVERRHFANVAVDLMSEISNPSEEWALKSQTAALVAEVIIFCIRTFLTGEGYHFPSGLYNFDIFLQIVRREGPSLWQELWPSIITLSNMGPIQVHCIITHAYMIFHCLELVENRAFVCARVGHTHKMQCDTKTFSLCPYGFIFAKPCCIQ